MCKFGNKNVLLLLWIFFFCGIFSIFQFSAFTENGNFQCFLKSFPQQFLVLSHTISNSFRLCKFKKLGLKMLVKMSLENIKKSNAALTYTEYPLRILKFEIRGKITEYDANGRGVACTKRCLCESVKNACGSLQIS